jgi:DUF1365 family protein
MCQARKVRGHVLRFFFLSLQYIFDVKQPQDEIMVSLEQWDKRIDMDKGKANDTIGFTITRVCCL